MTSELSTQNYALSLPSDEDHVEDLKLSSLIERGEESLNELLSNIDSAITELRGRFPDVLQSRAALLQLIAGVESDLSGKGFDNIVDNERNYGKGDKQPDLSGKDKKAMREMFKRIASLTHEDKLRSRGMEDEEITFLQTVFDDAKQMLESGDRFGLAYIYTSLLSKNNKKLTTAAIIEAKKAKLKSLQTQRSNIEKSFECQIFRVFLQDKNRAEVLYLNQAKKELEVLKLRLQRLTLLNNAEFVNSEGTVNDNS